MPCANCRFCFAPLSKTFCDLGSSPLANAYITQPTQQESFYPLHAYVCDQCLLVQLPTLHTAHEIFSEYAYFSSYSSSWLAHCKEYAREAAQRFGLNASSQVIEVASNDGYLLQYFQEMGIPVLGIEPAINVARVSVSKGIPTLPRFFGTQIVEEMQERADLLIGNNVLAHVPNLNDFVEALRRILKPQGVVSLEFPHLMQLIEQNQFDTIYHEHFSYFSLISVSKIFSAHGLEIFDVDLLSTHGGSLRIYAKHAENETHKVASNVEKLLQSEKQKGLDQLHTYLKFHPSTEAIKRELLDFITKVHREKKHIAAYGAPAKGNTLLNYCGLTPSLLPFTVDRNPYKQGKYLPGTHIPIFSPEKIRDFQPDYLLILPWNLKEEIMEETRYIRDWGGKFVIPIPSLHIH